MLNVGVLNINILHARMRDMLIHIFPRHKQCSHVRQPIHARAATHSSHTLP